MPVGQTKKIFISVSCLIVAISPLAITLFFLIQQQYVIHEMKEKLEMASLHTVTLNKEDIHWVKKGKEIRIGKDLFDVKSFSEKNGKVCFTGLYDHDETAIEKNLGALSGTNEDSQISLTNLLLLLQNTFTSPIDITLKKSEPLSLYIYPYFISSLLHLPRAVHKPPPRQ